MAKSIYTKLLILLLFLSVAGTASAKCDWYKMNTNWSYAVKGGTITVGLNLSNYPCIQEFWSLAGGTNVKGYYTSYTVQKNGIYKICMKLYDTCNKCDTTICKEIKVDGIKTCQWYKMSTNWSVTVKGGSIAVGLNIANYPCVQEFWSIAGGAYVKANSTTFNVSKNGAYTVCMKLYDTCLKCDTLICKEIKVDGINTCSVDFTADITKDGVKFKPNFPCSGKAFYSWKFGNGTYGNTGDPFVKYAKGTYEVCLTAKCYTYDQINKRYDSCEAKICKKIVVKENPCELKGDFSYKIGDKGLVVFEASANEKNLIYEWTIDNSSKKGRDFYMTLAPGLHKVCVTIYNPKTGCKVIVCKTIEVPKPKMECKLDFVATISNDGVKFKPVFPCNGTASYYWKLGDGTYSNNGDPFVKYKKGTYEICLYAKCKVYNQDKKAYDSCESKICKQIVIKTNPCELKGDFTYTIGDKGLVTFIATANEQNLIYEWTIDNDVKKGRDFKLTLSTGTHKVCVTIYNPKTGCKVVICKVVTINAPCNIEGFYRDSIVCNRIFLFGGSNSKDKVGYYYTIKGENISTIKQGQNAVFESSLPSGTYTICLYVLGYQNNGSEPTCRDTICKTFTLKSCSSKCIFPTGWSQTNATCSTFYFDGYKVIENNNIYTNPCHKYSWDFGDKITANGKTVKHEYAKSGTYTVCMKVIDTCKKCDTLICKTVTVSVCCKSQMNAEFSDTLKLGGIVRFVNLSTGGVYYKWLFGDNSVSNDKNNSHTYANAGSYTVCLVAYDSSKNCTDTFCKTIVVSIKRGSMASASINGFDSDNTWNFYPNPVSDALSITGFSFNSGDIITIRDITGKTVKVVNINNSTNNLSISMDQIVAGIYTIQCQTADGRSMQSKLIKQ